MKKIVLKVPIICSKCKVCILKAITKVCGIISISVDAEKGTVTIIGNVDPTAIVKELRKAGKTVEIDSVGPHKEEEKKEEKKKDEKKGCCKKDDKKKDGDKKDDDKKDKKKKCCKKECCMKECCKEECPTTVCKPLPPSCNAWRSHPYGNVVLYEYSKPCNVL